MSHWHSQRYQVEGKRRGIDPQVLERAIAIGKATQATNPQVPIIFTLRHLAEETEVPYAYLRKVVKRSDDVTPYRVFELHKKNAGHQPSRNRVVCAPDPYLLKVQRWIHENILKKGIVHEASCAYTNESRIAEAAELHCGARWLIKLDVTNFFESILEPSVYAIFRGFGYQPLVAFELGRLCTRLRHSGNPAKRSRTAYNSIHAYQNKILGHLPQGAPTSPLLANLASVNLDRAFAALAERNSLQYTRYADDITLSTVSKSFSRKIAVDVVRESYKVIRDHGLWPNLAKTHIVPPGARKIVLGLLVDGDKPRLTKEFKDRLRMHIYFLQHKDVGPARHAANRGFDSVIGLQHHVLGLAAFATGIESSWGKECFAKINAVNWPTTETIFE